MYSAAAVVASLDALRERLRVMIDSGHFNASIAGVDAQGDPFVASWEKAIYSEKADHRLEAIEFPVTVLVTVPTSPQRLAERDRALSQVTPGTRTMDFLDG
jgi:hypothetical protein